MRTLIIPEAIQLFQLKSYRKQKPQKVHVAEIIEEETEVIADGQVIAIYKKIDFDLTTIREACLQLKFDKYIRTSGLVTNTINIHASPRNPLRDNRCQMTKFHRYQPDLHN